MSKAPAAPSEQRSFRGRRSDIEGKRRERRDQITGLQSDQPGDADVNLDEQGRQANTRQNLTPNHKTQNR